MSSSHSLTVDLSLMATFFKPPLEKLEIEDNKFDLSGVGFGNEAAKAGEGGGPGGGGGGPPIPRAKFGGGPGGGGGPPVTVGGGPGG